jgi:MFS family permease
MVRAVDQADSVAMGAALPSAAVEESRNPFRTPAYRTYFAAVICGAMGVGIQIVTVPLFIRDRVSVDNRELLIGLALICQLLPQAVLILVGGVAADRLQRHRIITRVWVLASLVSLVYVGLAGWDVGAIWPVFILGAVIGSLDAFGQPARFSMPPQILPRSQVQNGIILNTVAFMAAFQFLGPSIGGLLADFANLTVAFAAEVVFLLIGAMLISRVRVAKPVPTGKSVLGDLADGLNYVRRSKTILALLGMQLIPGLFFMGPFRVTLVGFVEDVLHASDRFVGLLSGGFGIGTLLGSLLLTMVVIRRRGLVLTFAPIPGGVIFILYGLSTDVWLSLALMFAWGLSAAIFINMVTPLLQEAADPAMLGRVMSVSSLCFSISIPLGLAQAAVISTVWSPETAALVSGGISAGIGVLTAIALSPVRRLR